MTKEFSDHALRNYRTLLAAIDAFASERATLPMQYIRTFLLVALKEGKTVGEYATEADVSPSVMSRHIADLGVRTRGMQPGLGLLITKQNLENLREHAVYLTDKGRALAHKIDRTLER